MKNFLEATVIKSQAKLNLSIFLKSVGECECRLIVNNIVISDGILPQSFEFETQVRLTDPINISMVINNRQHPQAVIINGIYIDGYEIMPKYQQHSIPPTNYLDSNLTWTLEIPNFYPWYHGITGQGWIA